MLSGPRTTPHPPPDAARLCLKPEAKPVGVVDGGWWPRSADLPTELPAILTALWDRLGGIERVSYELAAWPGTPRRLVVDGRTVRLAGYRTQARHTIDLVSGHGQVTTLLVIPVQADQDAAEAALVAAAREGATDTVAELLEFATPPQVARTRAPA